MPRTIHTVAAITAATALTIGTATAPAAATTTKDDGRTRTTTASEWSVWSTRASQKCTKHGLDGTRLTAVLTIQERTSRKNRNRSQRRTSLTWSVPAASRGIGRNLIWPSAASLTRYYPQHHSRRPSNAIIRAAKPAAGVIRTNLVTDRPVRAEGIVVWTDQVLRGKKWATFTTGCDMTTRVVPAGPARGISDGGAF